jgi:hypothetical protein
MSKQSLNERKKEFLICFHQKKGGEEDDVTRCPRPLCPRPMCPLTKSQGHCVPWMMRPMEFTSLGCCVPDRCVLTLDCIKVLVKV